MGAILAKFRKTKTTAEVLEHLEEEIQQLEKYTLNTQEQKKRFVGGFLAFSIGLFVIAFVSIYFFYLPTTWKGRITYSIPMLLFPFVIILLRKVFTWYFQRKLNKNSDKLTELRAEKKKLLEQVMDKETYKVAVNLLARFGDRNSGSKYALAMTPRTTTNTTTTPTLANQSLRARGPAGDASAATAAAAGANQLRLFSSSTNNRSTPALQGTPRQAASMSQLGMAAPRQLALSPQSQPGQELRRRTPFPIVNQHDKGVFERIVDVLIGDGPQDRFAMICKECHAHNGMALKEEFDYTTFRCAFCNGMNPARKERPVAPRLPVQHHTIAAARNSSDSSSSEDSDDEPAYKQQVPPQRLTELTNDSIDAEADAISATTTSDADEQQQQQHNATATTAMPDIEIDDIEMIDSCTLDDAEQTVKTDESPAASHTPKLNDEFKKEM